MQVDTGAYEKLSRLPLRIDRHEVRLNEMEVSSGFARVTTEIMLEGNGHQGLGEDVSYDEQLQRARFPEVAALDLATNSTFGDFSERLESLFPVEQVEEKLYARWGFEGAALDLALKQAGLSFPEALGRGYRPLRFVVSTRLGSPPSAGIPKGWLAQHPKLEFKLDPQSSWSEELFRELAETESVRILDLKAAYVGTPVDQPYDPEMYERVKRYFPNAWIEDPSREPEAVAQLAEVRDRWSWDAIIHSVEDVKSLDSRPGAINIKPSRIGTLQRVLETIEYCLAQKIPLYGGGQFELGPGRAQIQALASLFYADGPNDVAPGGYNHGDPRPGLPASPLVPGTAKPGFRFPLE